MPTRMDCENCELMYIKKAAEILGYSSELLSRRILDDICKKCGKKGGLEVIE